MNTLLVGFGDSWTFGSELDRPWEQSWVVQLATKLNAKPVNLGTPASSIGHLTVQLFDFIKRKHTGQIIFMVGLSGATRYLSYSNQLGEFVNITPEANYRTGNIHESGRPPEVVREFGTLAGEMYRMVECDAYNQFLATQTVLLFQQYCKNNGIDVLFFSYFDKIKFDPGLVDTSLIYPITLTQALTGSEYELPAVRNNKYFQGKLFHPNILGHERMAQLLYEQYVQTYC